MTAPVAERPPLIHMGAAGAGGAVPAAIVRRAPPVGGGLLA